MNEWVYESFIAGDLVGLWPTLSAASRLKNKGCSTGGISRINRICPLALVPVAAKTEGDNFEEFADFLPVEQYMLRWESVNLR